MNRLRLFLGIAQVAVGIVVAIGSDMTGYAIGITVILFGAWLISVAIVEA